MAVLTEEIVREEKPFFRSIYLTINESGDIKIDCQDMGEVVQKVWGDSDYEFWVDVPSSETRKLLFALLREKFIAKDKAVDDFKDFCLKNKIAHKWESWV